MQLPSAFETVPSSLTVQICFAESEQSSMNSVWVAVPGTTPSAETHQSPIASWPGVPEPWVGKRAVMSLNEPSPGAVAMSSALGERRRDLHLLGRSVMSMTLDQSRARARLGKATS